jgi:hypothetical protein
MKNQFIPLLFTLIASAASVALAHEGIELGPNKGRIVEFSTDETLHGEVTLKDGKLHIALLDKDMKPVKPTTQKLTATAGTREMPQKLEIARDAAGFTLSTPGEGEWLILQYKAAPDAKPITARIHFDTATCAPCGNSEWRCACADVASKKP